MVVNLNQYRGTKEMFDNRKKADFNFITQAKTRQYFPNNMRVHDGFLPRNISNVYSKL